MSKKNLPKHQRPLSPKPAMKQEDTAYLVREELEAQQKPVKIMQAEAASAAPADIEATTSLKPLAPLASLWPGSAPTPAQAKTSAAPAPTTKPAPAPVSPPQSPGTAQMQKPTVVKMVNVTFVLSRPAARQATVCGDFNGWSPTGTPMKRHADGHWETTVALSPGEYQYKFLVDGEWIADPAAQKSLRNQYGSLNSVLEVRA